MLINGLAILSGSKSKEVRTSDLVKTFKIKNRTNERTSITGTPIIGVAWKYAKVNASAVGIINNNASCCQNIGIPILLAIITDTANPTKAPSVRLIAAPVFPYNGTSIK